MSETERRNPRHNASRRWSVTGAAAVAVCALTLPYLRLKRRHAELIIEHQATKLAAHIGVRRGRPRDELRVSPEIADMRARHIAEITELNKRGLHAPGR